MVIKNTSADEESFPFHLSRLSNDRRANRRMWNQLALPPTATALENESSRQGNSDLDSNQIWRRLTKQHPKQLGIPSESSKHFHHKTSPRHAQRKLRFCMCQEKFSGIPSELLKNSTDNFVSSGDPTHCDKRDLSALFTPFEIK